MSIGNRRHALFIQYMIESDGTPEGQIAAYMRAYPKCNHDSARSRSHKLSQDVEVSRLIKEGLDIKRQIIEEAKKTELLNQAKNDIISQTEVDAVLSKIISGKYMQQIKKVVFNPHRSVYEIVTVEQPPSASDITAAINLYNRRNGANAPTKFKQDDSTPPPANERDIVIIPGEDGND